MSLFDRLKDLSQIRVIENIYNLNPSNSTILSSWGPSNSTILENFRSPHTLNSLGDAPTFGYSRIYLRIYIITVALAKMDRGRPTKWRSPGRPTYLQTPIYLVLRGSEKTRISKKPSNQAFSTQNKYWVKHRILNLYTLPQKRSRFAKNVSFR